MEITANLELSEKDKEELSRILGCSVEALMGSNLDY